MTVPLKAPFPYFGGKARVASLIWERFGRVPNYVEPFFGSGAVLLGRPHPAGIETVNDKDCFLANFWRALQADPDGVARFADWPVNEADCHARHLWLRRQHDWRERLLTDPDYYDVKIAGWWVWGKSLWIGPDWCAGRDDLWARKDAASLTEESSLKLPSLSHVGRGVHRQLLHLTGRGNGGYRSPQIADYLADLSQRLRRVRVCCGEWTRVLGPTPTVHNGLTAVFLDPPYASDRDGEVYGVDSLTVAHEVASWATAHGNDPRLRIALCGYAGDYHLPSDWECVPWKAHGGYGNQGAGRGRANREREVIFFSPHCLQPRPTLFDLETVP